MASASADPPRLSNIPRPDAVPGAGTFGSVSPVLPSAGGAKQGAQRGSQRLPADDLLLRYLRIGNGLLSRSGGPDTVEFDLHALAQDAHRFHAEFSADPTAPTPFAAFATHFYALPRPELLIPAFMSLLSNPNGLAGMPQLGEALFLGRALGQLGDAAVPLAALMMRIVDEVGAVMVSRAKDEAEQATAARLVSARREAMVLVLLHAEHPELVAVAEQTVAQAEAAAEAIRSGRAGPDGAPLSPEEAEAAGHVAAETARRLRCILPADPAQRTPMQPLTWPLPGLPYEEATFYQGAFGATAPSWAKSTSLVSLALTAAEQGGSDGRGMTAETWARLSLAVGSSIQDGMWAEFHATGDTVSLRKCIAAAGEWIAFADEHGPEHILSIDDTPVPGPFAFPEQGQEADPDAADPRVRARFQLSRRAIARLVSEASRHPLVAEAVELERRDLAHALASAGPATSGAAAPRAMSAALEAFRPLVHVSLAQGRLAVPHYARLFCDRLADVMKPPDSEPEAEPMEPLPAAPAGMMPPGGLVALAWRLPPMTAKLWCGEDPLPRGVRPAVGSTDDQVADAVSRNDQTGLIGTLAPVKPAAGHPPPVEAAVAELAAALEACPVPQDWDTAFARANGPLLDGTVTHHLFDVARRARSGGAAPPGHEPELPPGAVPTRLG